MWSSAASVVALLLPGAVDAQQWATACSSDISLDATTNIWTNLTLHPQKYYREAVENAAKAINDTALREKAEKVAEVGTFYWMNTITDILYLYTAITEVPCGHVLGLVLHALPRLYCGIVGDPPMRPLDSASYQSQYIDTIATALKAYPRTAFALIIEPDALPPMITNVDFRKCNGPFNYMYRENVAYALKTLNLPNVIMYLDASHGGILGWNDNLKPAAGEIANVYKAAGKPSQFRGFATNVANWNAWDLEPGEFATADDSQWNRAQNEKKYVQLLGDALKATGTPNHAIVDTSRSGVAGLREDWLEWCNINGAGFGIRPSGVTGLELADAFVWAKNGGQSDGTSDPNAYRYVADCGKETSFKPSPEEGVWNQAYFEMLVTNAHPTF